MSSDQDYIVIPGKIDGQRVESRLLEERVQSAVAQGHTRLKIEAYGQQGIGGRLWKAGDTKIHVQVIGPIGQRAGSLGFPNTRIDIHGPTSDDVGWLNAGAEIVVHGNAATAPVTPWLRARYLWAAASAPAA
jgi:glutamate synthase domain-containing protein 3